ncbi:PCYCGC motif-containing (lipo)protein [Paenibacillus filicis]|uniref:PCYCGC motif-containing (Lipo)protein n=1 Tax=Paenibacillus filicis TaxID=669464 RepID=A0ABU9DRY4_9BACL
MKLIHSRIKPALALVLLASIAVACSPKPEAAGTHAGHEQHQMANGDIQETTASAAVLPKFLDKQTEEIRLVYQAAGHATDILKWMPCYCGCGESAGHQSNMNCFVKEVKPDGSIVWDDHGTRCGVCLQIAVKSIKLKQDGKSLLEIRQTIDQTYKQGYAKPTKTPMPSA